jgi:hypothetical protein
VDEITEHPVLAGYRHAVVVRYDDQPLELARLADWTPLDQWRVPLPRPPLIGGTS